ncbi:MAG: hypothetical protein R3267_04240 [Paenisporosarcina sp.]|nr:hypothetical protein [Paenisporosarcina sp.]
MIKVGDKRYNPDDIRIYYPDVYQSGFCIVIEWKSDHDPENVVFDTVQERDKTLAAMDEAFLIINEGEIVKREMEVDMPSIVFGSGDDMGGLGGINLQ